MSDRSVPLGGPDDEGARWTPDVDDGADFEAMRLGVRTLGEASDLRQLMIELDDATGPWDLHLFAAMHRVDSLREALERTPRRAEVEQLRAFVALRAAEAEVEALAQLAGGCR